jgi:hypothetical protein
MSKYDDAIDGGEKAFLRSAGLGDAHIQWRSSTFPDDMTLLDWFAGQAYTEAVEIVTVRGVERCREILESEEEPEPEPDDDTDRADLIAREAYRLAAAMIAEKRRREGGGNG